MLFAPIYNDFTNSIFFSIQSVIGETAFVARCPDDAAAEKSHGKKPRKKAKSACYTGYASMLVSLCTVKGNLGLFFQGPSKISQTTLHSVVCRQTSVMDSPV